MFQQVLLQILHKLNDERTVSAAYHLLKGKRSGQTIQDVGLFKLHAFFGLLPKLQRAVFDKEVATFMQYSWLKMQETGHYSLTKLGIQHAEQTLTFLLDGWHYRGNEHIFFARLSLVVQSLSYQKEKVKSFSPISKDEIVQKWVRAFLIDQQYSKNHLQQQLFEELSQVVEESVVSENSKQLLMYRLSGHSVPGWTWQQLASERKESELDSQLAFVEILHCLLNAVNKSETSPLLVKISEGLRVQAMLTESAQQTANLYEKGYSLEQIVHIRRLKQSTIEDHLVEFAMNEPNFSIGAFVTYEDAQSVLQASLNLQTKKLKVLHEELPHLSYFQLRLILAKGEV
ncbi:MAG: helix-turn-helix domain-containing protein [Lysinibacillus sp.]